MEFSISSLDAEAAREVQLERLARARSPRLPATTHRHLLALRLRRAGTRLEN